MQHTHPLGTMVPTATSLLNILGGAATGLVWGWLVGLLAGRVQHKLLTPLLMILASIPIGVEIWWHLGLSSLAWAGGAGVLSFSLHAAWRSHLRSQMQSHPQSFPPGTGGHP